MNDEIESVLNDLIETSKDGEKGFMKSAEDAHSAELKTMFAEGARRCREGARELQEQMRALGGDPEKSGSVAGAMHRGWISIKEAVSSRDDKTILEDCERGEDYAKKAYKKALEQDLPTNVRAIVERQYQGVMQNHDRVRALRDQHRAASGEAANSSMGRQHAAGSGSAAGRQRAGMVGESWPKSSQQDD